MRVWITISAVLGGVRNELSTPVPGSSLLAAVRAAGAAGPMSCELVDGTAVRIEADSKEQLGDLAEAVATWWRDEAPAGSGLMIGSPAGSSTTTFAAPDILVRAVRDCIEEYAWPVDSAIPDPSSVPRFGALRFTAHAVGVSEPGDEFEVLSAGVAEHANGDGLSLIFQGELESEPDEGYCLVSHTGATWYGGVVAVILRDRRLRVALTRDAARVLGLRPRITVHLAVDDDAVELLRDGLRRIFAASPKRGGAPRLDLD